MTERIQRNLLIVILLVLLIPVYAQQPGIKHFSVVDGANPIKINSLFKTNQGYIYTGTSNGLYKFDGIRFTHIPFQNPIKEPAITTIFQDSANTIWVGFRSGDIARLLNGKLKMYVPQEGTPKKAITGFLLDKDKNIWFSTDGEGIYYTYKDHVYNINVADGLAENNVYSMVLAENGDVIAGTDQGISICRVKGNEKKIINLGSKDGLPDNYVKMILPAGANRYWIAMQDKGICLFDNSSHKFTLPAISWNLGQINALMNVGSTLWIGTENYGIQKQTSIDLPPDSVLSAGSTSNITALMQDKEANFWYVLNSSELVKTPGEQLETVVSYGAGDFKNVHAIFSDHENNIWRGMENGVIKYSGKTIKKYFIKGVDEKAHVTAIYHDNFDHTWIGTRGKGVFILDEKTGAYRSIDENPTLRNSDILCIKGKENKVFVSSLEGAAEFNLTPAPVTSKYEFTDYANLNGIGINYIYDIFKDRKNRTWFGTDGKGLLMYDEGKVVQYDESKGVDKVVYSIAEDTNGNIWFSTYSSGVYKFDGTNFHNYTTADGLSSSEISAIKAGKYGNIFIVSKSGIDIFDVKTNRFSYIDAGMGIKEINITDLGSATQDTAGGIMVSTTDGIVRFQPVQGAIHYPATVLESVQLFFTQLDEKATHEFSHEENGFSFSFTGLYYTNPEPVEFQYMLEGYNNEWITTKDRTITFPKLSPNHYKFRVRSAINNQFEGADEASYEFTINKPFWIRWWFILLVIAVGGSLLYLYIKAREKGVKNVERLQQEKIQFQFETLRNQVNPHFLFNSFNTLISIIEDDPSTAVEYVEQLSDFFRNIVNYRDKDVIPLGEELNLLKTYFFIQQKRFGNNLQLKVDITDEQKQQIYIPPLTLQLLAENAIKHNAVSKEAPITIEILLADGYVMVRNNINAKLSKAAGAGMGLQNITNRYNLLAKKDVLINNDTLYFVVSLPTLQKS